jgi:hypothetical protein
MAESLYLQAEKIQISISTNLVFKDLCKDFRIFEELYSS